jgi:hypothetical protein
MLYQLLNLLFSLTKLFWDPEVFIYVKIKIIVFFGL